MGPLGIARLVGDVGHRLRWLVQMAGWVITAIGAAVVTGLIGRRD